MALYKMKIEENRCNGEGNQNSDIRVERGDEKQITSARWITKDTYIDEDGGSTTYS